MPLTNCQINLDLNLPQNCVIVASNADQEIFSITDTKFSVPALTLSTQDNAQLLEQSKFGPKSTTNWNRYQQNYQQNVSAEGRNKYLDFLIDQSFQGVNRLFVLSVDDKAQRTSYKIFRL